MNSLGWKLLSPNIQSLAQPERTPGDAIAARLGPVGAFLTSDAVGNEPVRGDPLGGGDTGRRPMPSVVLW